ncbi:MAG: TIGR03808 family TAT-translocated repetitive protein, partial [Hyphomicrobiaceae bacterium]|nr:TIGR03808 family TAT-translocated repetitive protein [Hyphomicrobiaceae bacterium]MDX2449671.1 TIGR03808 family TAT-translocated repetitive protein [Hyphomicrobiaceae bacterium]
MTIGRRELMLAGLGVGLAVVGPRLVAAQGSSNAGGVTPGDGVTDQTAALQDAADAAARSGAPLRLA